MAEKPKRRVDQAPSGRAKKKPKTAEFACCLGKHLGAFVIDTPVELPVYSQKNNDITAS